MMRRHAGRVVGDVVPLLLIEQKCLGPETVWLLLPSFRAKSIIAWPQHNAGRRVRIGVRCKEIGQQAASLAHWLVSELHPLTRSRCKMNRPVEVGKRQRGR